MHPLCGTDGEEGQQRRGQLSSALPAMSWLLQDAAQPKGALKQNTDVSILASPSLSGKVISGPICKLGLLPLVTDPNLLLSYFSWAETGA